MRALQICFAIRGPSGTVGCSDDTYSDLDPFRAIHREALERLSMRGETWGETWGWTVEMQVSVARQGLAVTEVPVACRRSIGVSEITGRFRAGSKILWVIGREALRRAWPGRA